MIADELPDNNESSEEFPGYNKLRSSYNSLVNLWQAASTASAEFLLDPQYAEMLFVWDSAIETVKSTVDDVFSAGYIDSIHSSRVADAQYALDSAWSKLHSYCARLGIHFEQPLSRQSKGAIALRILDQQPSIDAKELSGLSGIAAALTREWFYRDN